MNKQYITIILLLFICAILSFSLISKDSSSVSLECDGDRAANYVVTDFDELNYKDFFDVSDFGENSLSNIDIASKSYTNNSITVLDSSFKISDELVNNINNTINSYGASSSFYIVSLDDGMSIGYNIDKKFETASSIKAPYALYIYKEIDAGNIDPNQQIIYQEKYYNKGTGVIKKSDFGTSYTVRDLVYYSLFESDNIAHTMLHRTFGVKGYNNMLKNLGTKQLYLTAGNPWGYTSARSAALVWQEIYNFSITSDEGITFLNILSNGKYNYFKEVMPSIPSASKTGFASKDVVETGIVFGEHPYIAIAIANKGGNIGAYTQVLKLVSHMNDIMNEYDNYLKAK
ncbi:MAG: serine hydrolase [Candidatus Coprovivens sp.]